MLGNFIILLCLANLLPDVKDLEIIDKRNILLSCERGIGQGELVYMMSQIIPAFDRFLCQDLLGDRRIHIRIRRWR